MITVRKTGFQDWVRNVNFSGGSITLNAELDGANEMHAANVVPASTPNTSKTIGWIGVHTQNSGDVAVVTNVNPDSPGEKAGIQVGDVIVALDGRLIHNSDYASEDEAKAAIDQYFADRNLHFQQNPKRAGKKIWGKERVISVFKEGQNCKSPIYR